MSCQGSKDTKLWEPKVELRMYFFFFFGHTHSTWNVKVPWPGIGPAQQQLQPESQLWQHTRSLTCCAARELLNAFYSMKVPTFVPGSVQDPAMHYVKQTWSLCLWNVQPRGKERPYSSMYNIHRYVSYTNMIYAYSAYQLFVIYTYNHKC